MHIHRFFGEFDFSKQIILIEDISLINQLKNVLRLKKGDKIVLCDGKGNEAVGIIQEFEKKQCNVHIRKIERNENESEQGVVLYVSVLKRENFELVAQKAVEAGVSQIVPIRAERTIKQNIHQERIKKIIKEAAEQSERGIVPELGEIENFRDVVKNNTNNETSYLFDSSGISVNKRPKILEKRIRLFVGPEGGWTESELNFAKEYKMNVMSLGKRTLRAETAAIMATYLFSNP